MNAKIKLEMLKLNADRHFKLGLNGFMMRQNEREMEDQQIQQSFVKTLWDSHRERVDKAMAFPSTKVRLQQMSQLESMYWDSCYYRLRPQAKIKGIVEMVRLNQYEADLALFSMKTISTKKRAIKSLASTNNILISPHYRQ